MIGRGGMAMVHLARQIDLDRLVALKELSAFHAADPQWALRFVRESRLAGSLTHPNVVTVYDFFEWHGTPHIAMEYLERGSLRPYVGTLTPAQTGGVLAGVLAGLRHAERRGIVHRDLKPENLLVSDDGDVKITDFGIAKATSELRPGAFRTATGMTVGTPGYMAPEQAMGRSVGPWTDLYSLGCIAYELYVGRPPFGGTDEPLALLLRHVNEPVVPAIDAAPDVAPAVSAWIDGLLVKDPARRVRSAEDAWASLEEILIDALGPRWRRAAALPALPYGSVPGPATPPPAGSLSPYTPPPADSLQTPNAALPVAPSGPPDDSLAPPAAEAPHTAEPTARTSGFVTFQQPGPLAPPFETPVTEAPASPALRDHGTSEPSVPEAPVSPPPLEPSRSDRSEPPASAPPGPGEPYDRHDAAPEAPATVPPARPPVMTPETPAHDRRGRRFVIAVAVAVAAAGAAGYVATRDTPPTPDATPKTPRDQAALEPQRLARAAGPIRFSATREWSVGTGMAAGVELAEATTLKSGDGEITVGMASPAGVTKDLLPNGLAERLAEGASKPKTVQLASGLRALRHPRLAPAGSASPLTVVAIPTSAGVATLACTAPEATCDGIADTLRLTGARALDPDAAARYGGALERAVTRLNRARGRDERALRQARTTGGQASRAMALRGDERRAASAIADLGPASEDVAAHRRLVAALRAGGDAYGDLAQAAQKDRPAGYRQAAARVRRAHETAQAHLASLRGLGYRPWLTARLQAVTIPALRRPAPDPQATPTPSPSATVVPTATATPPVNPTPGGPPSSEPTPKPTPEFGDG